MAFDSAAGHFLSSVLRGVLASALRVIVAGRQGALKLLYVFHKLYLCKNVFSSCKPSYWILKIWLVHRRTSKKLSKEVEKLPRRKSFTLHRLRNIFSLAITVFHHLGDTFDRNWRRKEIDGVLSSLKWLIFFTSANKVGEVMFSPLFVCLSVCEQLPDHNFSCGVMKLSGINCCVKIWKWFIFERSSKRSNSLTWL